jgi:hypothetical protein
MAMKKAELEHHQASYHARIQRARTALERRDYREAIEHAMSTFEYVDGMMQFERKYRRPDVFERRKHRYGPSVRAAAASLPKLEGS